MLTTEQCLLNPNRNPQMTRHDIEAMLMRYLGTSDVFWLGLYAALRPAVAAVGGILVVLAILRATIR